MARGRPSSRGADRGDRRRIGVVDVEVGARGLGALDEQRDGVVLRQRVERRQAARSRAGPAAGRGTPARRAGAAPRGWSRARSGRALPRAARRRAAAPACELLEVVEHQQQAPVAQVGLQRARSGRSGSSRTPSAAAIVVGMSGGSVSGERSAKKTPPVNSRAHCGATCRASRVLPVPPGPVRVSRRECRAGRRRRATSCSRPTKLGHLGRQVRRGLERARRRELLRQARDRPAGRAAPADRGP